MNALQDPAPHSGVFRGPLHILPVRVYYENTDAGGIVYHSDYLNFAERARTEMMRRFGLSHGDLMAEAGVGFAVQHAEATFHKPARLDDLLMVETRILEVGGASMRLGQEITRQGERLVSLLLRLALVTERGRPGRIPPSLRTALRDHLAAHPADAPAPETHGS
ncbi:YbgC/FadM family acyl-CoA thioesterase [Roseospira navarrensis]|uniref:YbgC/FadM family acyl-CoA thioesterase n=1 Tax=Roseospira navarrensis TaxID=140058 RepID=A0A7X2D2V9_9PROT|nr:YbgC/FadM family acyl-CoA thioesterase [Roseospira navarrensis]MQX36188.1 YbgC/FadM family acyl-CoA thioesterase [Roseospira navarrensis]